MTRKALQGVEYRFNWTSLAGCLEALLAFEGKPLARPELMVLSGLAFRFTIRREGRVLAASALNAYDPKKLAAALRRLGLEFELFASREAQGPGRERGLGLMRRCVDRKHPAIAYGLQLPEFGLVWGYDDEAETLAVKTLLSEMVGELLPWSDYPAQEAGMQMVLALQKTQRPKREAALCEALREGIAFAKRGDLDDTALAQGFAAFEAWSRVLAGDQPVDPLGNAHTIQTLQAARSDAAAFLATRPELALRQAAAAYQAEAVVLSRLATYFPFPAGGDVTNPGVRSLAAGAVRAALTHEREAIEALARAPRA